MSGIQRGKGETASEGLLAHSWLVTAVFVIVMQLPPSCYAQVIMTNILPPCPCSRSTLDGSLPCGVHAVGMCIYLELQNALFDVFILCFIDFLYSNCDKQISIS